MKKQEMNYDFKGYKWESENIDVKSIYKKLLAHKLFDVFVINESETADIILKAQSAAKETIKPGVKMSIIDKAARDIINKACYEKYYIYIPGYGVGSRYHEFPPLLAPGNDTLLKEEMVTSVEPGLYIPGFGGLRFEDKVAIGKYGFDELSTFNRNLG